MPEGQTEIVPHGAGMIPPMPTTIPRDLNDWMQERHGELQEAMNELHNSKVVELTSMLSNAAEKMCEMTGGMMS